MKGDIRLTFRGFSLLLFLFAVQSGLTASPALPFGHLTNPPGLKDQLKNSESVSFQAYKPLAPWEYVLDELILYSSLWLAAGVTAPLWEGGVSFPGSSDGTTFGDRLLMEPFKTNKEDVFSPLKDRNGNVVKDSHGYPVMMPNGSFYAKNIIEPLVFTYMSLYARSKNHHPVLVVAEIFAMSLLYEFTIRPLFRDASFEQLLKNPAVGIVAGVLLDELATYLLTTPYQGLHVFAYILNPFKAIPNARIHPLLFFNPYHKAVSLQVSMGF